jgi:hypothetical protein
MNEHYGLNQNEFTPIVYSVEFHMITGSSIWVMNNSFFAEFLFLVRSVWIKEAKNDSR